MRYDCLIVDDEAVLAETTSEYLNLFDVKAAYVTSAEECLAFMREHEVSLLLLDINLEGASGFELCKELRRKTEIPILFISARSSDDDIVVALNIGGDDYIRKPYTLSVLLAKVRAVLKRYGGVKPSEGILRAGSLELDCNRCSLRVGGEEVRLKTLEFRLLAYLVRNRNRVLPKEELFREVWGDSITGDGTLNVHIRHLRTKIETDPDNPRYIKTVWGTGYLFEDGGA
ncbi:two-component system, OmpR family, response regulator RegX3 [Paenibacillus sophorae]|uniref:Response regulator transcription factor n=1 Tax=Paenibacillus sophorae TaxID=1333845 RepID=A0A1H8SQ12_9BACL|nr:response regulator transcription factor [Paenibacillus sophorae]QWU15513.1 response regulator transcription factor [Paenibacillus sophorae]SEO80667.1 two-component system, OmpR family, response regulator RegX3 [Paenibacillus sophorae]